MARQGKSELWEPSGICDISTRPLLSDASSQALKNEAKGRKEGSYPSRCESDIVPTRCGPSAIAVNRAAPAEPLGCSFRPGSNTDTLELAACDVA